MYGAIMRHIPVFGREQYFLNRESGISVDVSKLSTLPGVHTHDFHEFFIVAEGSALHMVNNSVELVSKGDIFLIRPSDVHCYNFYRSDDFRICNIAFGDAVYREVADFLGQPEALSGLDATARPPHRKLGYMEAEFIIKSIVGIGSLLAEGDKLAARCSGKSLVAFILQHFFLSAGAQDDNDSQIPQWLRTLVSQMKRQENFKGGYARMCELAPCSSNHLCRCFRKYYDERPCDFINRERLKYSLFLLHETDCTILEISDSCGFSNLSHFYHLFRKSFSVSPQKARKMGECIPGST